MSSLSIFFKEVTIDNIFLTVCKQYGTMSGHVIISEMLHECRMTLEIYSQQCDRKHEIRNVCMLQF